MKQKITIFSDGAAKGNPGNGGYGAVIVYDEVVEEIGAYKEYTTNNEMELKAVIEALKKIAHFNQPVAIYTDSKYVVEGASGWVFGWVKNDWKTKNKTDVLNKELWQDLLPLLSKVNIEWHKVPGHVGIIGNERADTIASDFAEGKQVLLYKGARRAYNLNIDDTSYDEVSAKKRSDARSRGKRKAYSYVSLVDGIVQTHQTWTECEARVKGKKGVKFKKTFDVSDEKAIIKDFGG